MIGHTISFFINEKLFMPDKKLTDEMDRYRSTLPHHSVIGPFI